MYEETSLDKRLLKLFIYGHIYLFFLTKVINKNGHLESYWSFWLLFFKTVVPLGIAIFFIYHITCYFQEIKEEKKRVIEEKEQEIKEKEERRKEKIRGRKKELKQKEKERKFKEEEKKLQKEQEILRRKKTSQDVLNDATNDFLN